MEEKIEKKINKKVEELKQIADQDRAICGDAFIEFGPRSINVVDPTTIKQFQKKARAAALQFRPYKKVEIDNYTRCEFWIRSASTGEVYTISAKIHYDGREEWHCHCHNYTFKCTSEENYQCKHIIRCRDKLVEDGVLE